MIEVCMLVKVTRLMVFLTSGPCISCHWLLVFPFHVSRLTAFPALGKKIGRLGGKRSSPKKAPISEHSAVLYLSLNPLYRISLARRSHCTLLVRSHKGAAEFQEK